MATRVRKVTREERNRELIRKYQETGDQEAVTEFVQLNRALVMTICKKHAAWYEGPYMRNCMLTDGETGLWKAMRDFDFSRKTLVSTYVYWKVRGEIKHNYAEGIIHIPESSTAEIAVHQEGEFTSMDHYTSDQTETDKQAQKRREEVESLLAVLDGRDREIAEMRWGLMGRPIHSLPEIAQIFGFSRQRADQVCSRCLHALKIAMDRRERGVA